jgi:hypothetical protein
MARTLVTSLTAVALLAAPVLAQAQATDCQALMSQVLAATDNRLDYSANWAKDRLVEAANLLKGNKQAECIVKVEEAANSLQLTLRK